MRRTSRPMPRRACLVLMAVLIAVGTGYVPPADFRVIGQMEEVEALLQHPPPDTVWIDLRDNRPYQGSHLVNALNVPFDDGGAWLLAYLREHHLQHKRIVLVCARGVRSGKAAELLMRAGLRRVWRVGFGYDAYAATHGVRYLQGRDVCDCGKDPVAR